MIATTLPSYRKAISIVVLVAATLAIASFWVRTGLNMYPLDDGWVSFSVIDMQFDLADFLFSSSRELRNLPYIIAKAMEASGFHAINAILIGIDALTFLGLFRICLFLLPGRTVAAFMAAGLAMFFPNDHTMFWLGAFGVNLSYLLLVWATVVAFAAIDRQRPWLHLAGLVLLFCGIRTYSGYVFLPLILVSGFLYMQAGAHGYLRGFTRHILPQWLAFAIALAPTLQGLIHGNGREGRVASLDIGQALAGYRAMFANLFWRWPDDLWPPTHWMLPYAVFFVVLFSAVILLLVRIQRRDDRAHARTSTGGSNRIILVLVCAALVLLCYLPYAVSDIRFDHGRALIGSRFGLALMLVAIVDGWQLRHGRPITARALCMIGVVLLALFCLNRLSIFDARHERSLYQRVLLADLASAVPCPAPGTPIVLIIRQGEFGADKGGKMLVNRPQYLLRALYANDDIEAYTVSNWLLGLHGRIDTQDGTVIYRRGDLGPAPLLLRYAFDTGIQHVSQARLRVGRAHTWVMVPGSPLPADQCQRAPLVRRLAGKRDVYLARLDLPAKVPAGKQAKHPH